MEIEYTPEARAAALPVSHTPATPYPSLSPPRLTVCLCAARHRISHLSEEGDLYATSLFPGRRRPDNF